MAARAIWGMLIWKFFDRRLMRFSASLTRSAFQKQPPGWRVPSIQLMQILRVRRR